MDVLIDVCVYIHMNMDAYNYIYISMNMDMGIEFFTLRSIKNYFFCIPLSIYVKLRF
jgi:hypothetical protein